MFVTNGRMLNDAAGNINTIIIATEEQKVREDGENHDYELRHLYSSPHILG